MPAPPVLETKRLRLRPLGPDDAVAVHHLASRREIADTTLSIPHPLSLDQAQEWIAARTARVADGQGMAFAIAIKDGGPLVGTIGLRQVDGEHRQAEMGFWIAVEHWGRGYATEAARAVIRDGFERLGLNRICAQHMVRNPASGRVLEKAGMQREGVLRQAMRKWGVFEDVMVWAILRRDWALPPVVPGQDARRAILAQTATNQSVQPVEGGE